MIAKAKKVKVDNIEHVLAIIAPERNVDNLPIGNATAVIDVSTVILPDDALSLPRNDDFDSTLVGVKRFYDGSAGGEPGHYVMLWLEFDFQRKSYRTQGTKIRAGEAPRIARAMLKSVASKPATKEAPRIGGKMAELEASELRGWPVGKNYLVAVRYVGRGGRVMRKAGVEILNKERAQVAAYLQEALFNG